MSLDPIPKGTCVATVAALHFSGTKAFPVQTLCKLVWQPMQLVYGDVLDNFLLKVMTFLAGHQLLNRFCMAQAFYQVQDWDCHDVNLEPCHTFYSTSIHAKCAHGLQGADNKSRISQNTPATCFTLWT